MKTQSARKRRILRNKSRSGSGKSVRNMAAPRSTEKAKEPNPIDTLESEGGIPAAKSEALPFALSYSKRLMM
jgi:hypothetical protein